MPNVLYSLNLIFLDLTVYPQFTRETLIPTRFISHFSAEGNVICILQLACDHPCIVQGHHLHRIQCSMAASGHSLYQLEVVTACSFCVAFECCNFFLEVI
jgi:hypothetical protein